MKKGLSRFNFYLDQIQEQLDVAGKETDPGKWLFDKNARTQFFMLEGLARLYEDMLCEKKFTRLKKQSKLIEDGFGQVDYYNWLVVSFKGNRKVPAECKQYFKEKLALASNKLNELLVDDNWLPADGKKIKKITKKLNDADWSKSGKEVKSIAACYEKYITDINEFVVKTNYHFDNVEEDVHELRRRLRWLSIYPQALQGVIQYTEDMKGPVHLKKYLTKEITESPYNQLPAPGDNKNLLLFHKGYFLALSWVISKLGKLKDEGLLVTGLADALQQAKGSGEMDAMKKAYSILEKDPGRMQAILDEAEKIMRAFIRENNLGRLIVKII
jgi:hypothetical protein